MWQRRLRVCARFRLFVGFSGQLFPAGLEVNALVPGLEPMDETAADAALSVLSM
jgi:hypothetical protein